MSGCEWVVEAYGCDRAALRDCARLQALFARLVEDLDLHPLDQAAWHVFPGEGGVTGFHLLAESHIACHTFPEYGSLCLNLFCCRPRPDCDFRWYLEQELGARQVRVRRLERAYRTA